MRRLLVLVCTAVLAAGCSDDDAEVSSLTTEPAVTTTSTTSMTLGATSSTVDPTPCPVPAEEIAVDLGRSPEDVNGPHDCSGDWGWIDLECEQPDPEVGCLHSGNVVHRVDGRWVRVDALLQDCAESFTRHGAPAEDAEALYPPCF